MRRPAGRGGAVRFEASTSATTRGGRSCTDVISRCPPGRRSRWSAHSGSGKSTLARLLYRFYDVQGGAIRINGADIRELTQQSLRAAIGIVPQDTVLFNDTHLLQHPVRPAPDAPARRWSPRPGRAHPRLHRAACPTATKPRVGERGLKLSGGEKQRVAIARAILKNPAS
jgi:ATP-binding cassette, subfamily B, heavy metal transporter